MRLRRRAWTVRAGVLAAIAAWTPAFGAAWASDVVRLRSTVRLGAETQRVTLGDIAVLEGPKAEALAGVVLIEDLGREGGADGWVSIDSERVREAIRPGPREAVAGLVIEGHASSVRRMPRAEVVAAPEPAREHARGPAEAGVKPGTVAAAAVETVARSLGVGVAEVRVTFEARDAGLLGLDAAGRTLEIRPMGSGDRIPLSVRVYGGDSIEASGTVRASVLVRRDVAVATASLRRGEIIDGSRVREEERWVTPTTRTMTLSEALGQAVKSRLEPGSAVERDGVEPPWAVKRGELVVVHHLAGTFVLKLTCRALGDARLGEAAEFETLEGDRRARRTIVARMSGPGVAIAAGPREAER